MKKILLLLILLCGALKFSYSQNFSNGFTSTEQSVNGFKNILPYNDDEGKYLEFFSCFGVGLDFQTMNNSELELDDLPTYGLYGYVDYSFPRSRLAVGLECRVLKTSQGKGYRLVDFGLRAGGFVRRGKKLQFPLFAECKIFMLDEYENDYTYTLFGLGLKGGVRYFLNSKFAIEAHYNPNIYSISSKNEDKVEDGPWQLKANSISIGIVIIMTE